MGTPVVDLLGAWLTQLCDTILDAIGCITVQYTSGCIAVGSPLAFGPSPPPSALPALVPLWL